MSLNTTETCISSAGDHDKTESTEIIVSAYYRVHPDDRETFIEAVRPEMLAAQQLPGCVYYAFSGSGQSRRFSSVRGLGGY
jgi:hypothetical protein